MQAPINTSALLITALLSSAAAQAENWTGHSSLLLGSKQIEEAHWAKDDEHGAIGVIIDFRKEGWPVSIAVDLFGTGSERTVAGDKHETYTAEAHLGIRKVFDITDCRIHPYVGGGIAISNVEQQDRIEGVTRSHSDGDSSGWAGAGAYIEVSPRFTLGVDLRYSEAKVRLLDNAVDASGTLAGFTAGYHW